MINFNQKELYKEIKETLEALFLFGAGKRINMLSNELSGMNNYGCFKKDYDKIEKQNPFRNYVLLDQVEDIYERRMKIYKLTKDEYGIVRYSTFIGSNDNCYTRGFTTFVIMKQNYYVSDGGRNVISLDTYIKDIYDKVLSRKDKQVHLEDIYDGILDAGKKLSINGLKLIILKERKIC